MDLDRKHKNVIVICGARCVFQKVGKCQNKKKTAGEIIAAVIGIDGNCVKFETAEKK